MPQTLDTYVTLPALDCFAGITAAYRKIAAARKDGALRRDEGLDGGLDEGLDEGLRKEEMTVNRYNNITSQHLIFDNCYLIKIWLFRESLSTT
ncbi:MAG: hypothetical protein LBM98_12815 [Oscillospiraceae bacterium]|nr:hypothetical protein [Oscillospiraceae bacterium]